MSEVGVYPTFELSTPLDAAAPAPGKHASDSDVPYTEYLSSSPPGETSTIVTGTGWANSKSSDSVAAAAAIALIPHCHPSPAKQATEPSSLVLGSEAEQSLGDVSSNLHASDGVTTSPTPPILMSRRATLPFTADATSHRDGGTSTSEGAFRVVLPTLVGCPETLCAQDSTSCATHARVAFVAEIEPSSADQQLRFDPLDSLRRTTVCNVAAEDASAAERGRVSLSDSLTSALDAARDDGRARQAMDVACAPCSAISADFTPLTVMGMTHAERYFSSLCAKWRPEALLSADSEAASSSSLCLCAVGNDIDSSLPSCGCSCFTRRPNRNSVSHLLSGTMPPAAMPLGVPTAAFTSAVSVQHMPQRFLLLTPGDAISSTTILTAAAVASSTSDDGDEMRLSDLFPETCTGADTVLHTKREGREVDAERVLGVSGEPTAVICIDAEISSTLHDVISAKRDGTSDERIALCPGVSGMGVGSCTERGDRLKLTPPHVLAQSNTLLFTDIREMYTSSLATEITSQAAQQSSSSMQLLGLREGRSFVARLSAPQALQHHGSCGGNPTASVPGSSLGSMEGPQEHERGLLLSFSPCDTTLRGRKYRLAPTSGGTPSAATDSSSKLSSLSSSWPPLTHERRRDAVTIPAEAESLSEEEAEVNRQSRLDTPDEEKTVTLISAEPSRFVWREPDGAAEGCRELVDTVLTAPVMPSSRTAGISSGPSGDAAAASVSLAYTCLLPFLQSHLSKWLCWVSRKYHGVVLRTSGVVGEQRSLQPLSSPSLPKSCSAFQKKANDGSSGCRSFFTPEASAEAVDNVKVGLYDVGFSKSDIPHLSLTLSLSGSPVNSSYEGEQSRDTWAQETVSGLTSPWNGGGNSSWLSVGLQAEQRGMVCATGELMQLRSSFALPPLSSSLSPDAPFPTSSRERRCVSPTQQSPSLSVESLTGSQILSGSGLQWPSRGLVGVLNSSARCTCLSGDYQSPSFHSSLGCRSRMGGSTASTIADDRHRDALYHLFNQPPSSLMGNLTECYETYQAMLDTFSKGHHRLSWSELGPLLRPEDYLDYRALFPPQHFVTFEDFVEFVEVVSVRYRR